MANSSIDYGKFSESLVNKLDIDGGNSTKWGAIAILAAANNLPVVNHLNGEWLFGYEWDLTQPDPTLAIKPIPGTDNTFYAPCYMDFATGTFNWGDWKDAPFLPKSCVLDYTGNVTNYLDENDNTKTVEGAAIDTSHALNGNVMMEWNSIFRYKYFKGTKQYCLFSNKKINNNFECWSTKLADGTYAQHFYTAKYLGTKDSSGRLRSCYTNTLPWGTTGGADAERTAARANGSNNWDIRTRSDSDLLVDLYLLMFMNPNSQAALGFGATSSNNSLTVNTGVLYNAGLFFGTAAASAHGVKFFGMEQWYGEEWQREVGCINNKGIYYLKHTRSAIDGTGIDDYNTTGESYINSGLAVPAANASYIVMPYSTSHGEYLPKSVGGSSTTYTCDAMWSNNGQVDTLFRGGGVRNGAECGVLCFNVNNLASNSNWNIGASLSYKMYFLKMLLFSCTHTSKN